MGKEAEPRRTVGVVAATTISVLLLPLIYAMIFSPYTSPLDFWMCRARAGTIAGASSGSINNGSREEYDSLTSQLGRLLRGKDRMELETTGFGCKSDPDNDVCVSNQRVWMKTELGNLTLYLSSSSSSSNNNQSLQQMPRMVRPYVKKNDNHARRYVKEITIQRLIHNYTTKPLACDVIHDVPAVVFSSGLTGNTYHELNEIIIPLFLTSHHFRSQLRFVISDYNPFWVNKFRRILSHLTDYELINPSQDTRIHCFRGAVIGLHFHKQSLVCKNNDLPINCSMLGFKEFLREAFHLKIKNVDQLFDKGTNRKPVLVLISRKRSRRFLNEAEMVKVGTELGFQVVLAPPNLTSNLDELSGVVNSCSVLVGAHGAGLSNEVFMPEGSVMVQIVPLGLEWASTNYFGNSMGEMGVKYLEYKINPRESTLFDVYGPEHPVITDPNSIHRQGYDITRAIYVDGQDFRINVFNFKYTLEQALKFLGR